MFKNARSRSTMLRKGGAASNKGKYQTLSKGSLLNLSMTHDTIDVAKNANNFNR